MKHVQRMPEWTFCGKRISRMKGIVKREDVDLEDPNLCKSCKRGVASLSSNPTKVMNPNIKHVPRTANRAFCGRPLTKVEHPVSKENVDLNDPDLCCTCKRGIESPTFFKFLMVWRNERHEEGLARITESPRGVNLFVNGVEVANIIANRIAPLKYEGWIWYTTHEPCEKLPFEIPRKNTSGHPVATLEDAKTECKAYIKKKLEEARGVGSVAEGVSKKDSSLRSFPANSELPAE